jgi:hypothetical protein
MKLDAKTSARVAILNKEMDDIHLANNLYWKQEQHQTGAAKAQYQFRNNQLEKILTEFSQLQRATFQMEDGTNTTHGASPP